MKASKSKMKHEFKVEIARQVEHAMPEMHYHDFYEIYIQDKGVRDHIVGDQYLKLNPGDVVLIKPNVLHQSISKTRHTRTIVYFTEEYLKQYFSTSQCEKFLSLFQCTHSSLNHDNYYKISGLVREMSKENLNNPANIIYVKLAELFMILLLNMKQTSSEWYEDTIAPIFKNPYAPNLSRLSYSEEKIGKTSLALISYVHENYLTLTNISEIAETFYITPSHLCRTFKKLTGYTVVQYLNILKIQKACDLLLNTTKPMTEIAMDCGFHSSMYFCKTFKAIMQVTPGTYRKH